MRKKKKLIITVVILVLILLCGCIFASCNKEKPAPKDETVTTQEERADSKDEEKEVENDELENDSEDIEEVEAIETEVEEIEKNSESNKSEKTETAKKEKTTTKTETNSSSTSKKEETKKEEEKHTHDWEPVYKEVDNGYYEKVLVKEAWTEEVVKQKKVGAEICKGCGHAMFTVEDIYNHCGPAMLAGNTKCGTYKSGYVDVEVTETVEHPAEYKDVWVPNIEKVQTGYKCSCGATK